jgi:hypothetical protein
MSIKTILIYMIYIRENEEIFHAEPRQLMLLIEAKHRQKGQFQG